MPPTRGSMTPSGNKIADYQNKLSSIKKQFGKATSGAETVKNVTN